MMYLKDQTKLKDAKGLRLQFCLFQKKKKRVCREQPRILISKSVHLFTSRIIGGVQGQLELGVTPQILKYVLFLYKK